MTLQNRQTQRTRAAITSAFAELVFTTRYNDIRMIDVARCANVGRSTLYLHYPDKDAILLENMAPLLADLCEATHGITAQDKIEAALRHIWSHRDRGRVVLFGTTGQRLERALAARIILTTRTEADTSTDTPTGTDTDTMSAAFLANSIAASVFAVLRTWLMGEASGTIPDIARHICLSSRAILTASD